MLFIRKPPDLNPVGFIEPCRPTKAPALGATLDFTKSKHDGFRLLVRGEAHKCAAHAKVRPLALVKREKID